MSYCAEFINNECAICDCRSIFVAQENRSTYRLINLEREHICQVELDGCYINNTQKRCDYAFVFCERPLIVLVELKGNKLGTAIEQIDRTLGSFGTQLIGRVEARIIVSKVTQRSGQRNPKQINLAKKLARRQGKLEIKSIRMEESF